ncbi:retrovirus-related pol polyprotein from transposon TNT 1-94 [Tanacetum coccineum]
MLPGENINEYYVRFHKLVNDMWNIRISMPNIQLNSKFVNNMSPEWDRFVTAVKLNKGLKETNHEQLFSLINIHYPQHLFSHLMSNHFTGNGGAQNRAGNANASQGKPIKCYNCNGLGHIARNLLDEEELLFLAGEKTNTFDADVDNQPVRDLALNEDNIFLVDECDAFDSDVDDEPTA